MITENKYFFIDGEIIQAKNKIQKRYENDELHLVCGWCGELLGTAPAEYGGTDGCEVWEVQLWEEHAENCPVLLSEKEKLSGKSV